MDSEIRKPIHAQGFEGLVEQLKENNYGNKILL